LNGVYVRRANSFVTRTLCRFIEVEVLPETGINEEIFWLGFGKIIKKFSPVNHALLQKRKQLQSQIHHWHQSHSSFSPLSPNGQEHTEYQKLLYSIGYIVPECEDFQITTSQLDQEISQQAGPQLLVSANNTAELLAARNARWGSLYRAVYDSDLLPKTNTAETYERFNTERMQKTIHFSKQFLDTAAPLKLGSHSNVHQYYVKEGQLIATLNENIDTTLQNHACLLAYQGKPENPCTVLLCHNRLRFEIRIDRDSETGRLDLSGIEDIVLESALSAIVDCDDTAYNADLNSKIHVYRNWLLLMKGSLQAPSGDVNSTASETINANREYTSTSGETFSVPGRTLLLIRNVGMLTNHNGVLDEAKQPVPEGIVDTVVTSLIALHDLKRPRNNRNSYKGNIYSIKPNLHGPEEVAYTNALYEATEELLGLQANTLKLGLMDDERRTSLNLKNCLGAARHRLFLLQVDTLNRSADEIHTSTYAGPVGAANAITQEAWHQAFEQNYLITALKCGLPGRAQIGKGIWNKPDKMAAMMQTSIIHPQTGATASLVPTAQAATLHAIHYHKVNVYRQQQLQRGKVLPKLKLLLKIPILTNTDTLTPSVINAEVECDCQSILAYLLPWKNFDSVASSMPGFSGEHTPDSKAAARVASQHLSNWLLHKICSSEEVECALLKIAKRIDAHLNNSYLRETSEISPIISEALVAARTLIFNALDSPNGYTEPMLRSYRQ